MTEPPVLVIGDVHGCVERLVALIRKTREQVDGVFYTVQLGDLGHFGRDTKAQDRESWEAADAGLVDLVLWGNHDRAVVDRAHGFGGYSEPFPETVEIMNKMERAGRLRFAYAAHGWLVTHAGLHRQFDYVDADKRDASVIAEWLNNHGRRTAMMNAISHERGGLSSFGGALWRDVSEPLWSGVRQVFGHSVSSDHVVRGEKDSWWCVDIGGKPSSTSPEADCLAGVLLPSQEIVRVGPQEVLECR